MWGWFFLVAVAALFSRGTCAGAGAARLICYSEGGRTDGFTECTHLVYKGDVRGDKLEALLKEYRKSNPRLKIIVRVAEEDKDLRSLLKSKHVQGLELHDAHRSLNRSKVLDAVEAARAAISSSGGGPLFLSLPSHPELLAKYYDLRTLMKKVDLMMVQTHALGHVNKMTYHPSRLSGLWDMMNTDSVVDLVVGLGVPASKIVISLPATVRQFHLLNETLSTPGSPTTEDEPKEIDQAELCRLLQKGRWTLERDQDLSAPYAFKDKTWLSFEDSSSVDVKGKYARVRGLAGLALHKADKDVETPCGPTLKTSLAKVLNQQSRAPRAAVLRSLEHEILSAPAHARSLDALQVSPYRITQIVDSDGVIHSIREDTRTEFSCSRQGYFVHPRSCARFYRCVKFDQLSPEYTVFEFDCPAGLAFDSRYEVCVWPGSLPHSQACPGSSEIAPVPHTRFICPEHEGYYADPENCRWFFACLDHGKAPLTAYEFRCPFGLGFDAEKLKCDWPWLVPACGNIARYEAEAFGFGSSVLTGATGFQGQTADAINIAAHQSLVSGASLDNLVGIQSGFLSQSDALDSNFIASQEYANAGHDYQDGNTFAVGGANPGLVQATKYTSGSLILDDYRLPTKEESFKGHGHQSYSASFGNQKSLQYQSSDYDGDHSGAYVHDPIGDYAEPYKHIDGPVVPYIHTDSKTNDYFDYGKYTDAQNYGKYKDSQDYGKYSSSLDYSSKYAHDNSGAYVESGSNINAYSGAYNDYSGSYTSDDTGKYLAGVYRANGHIGNYEGANYGHSVQHGSYSSGNAGYLSSTKAYTGASHTLANGAVNVGIVGKTTLVDANYNDQFNYKASQLGHHIEYNPHAPNIKESLVSINHIGTDGNNLDGYGFVTTPTSSGVPTTATPIEVTTAIPVTTYKTTFVPETPKTDIKQIFGYSQSPVTYVQPTITTIKQYVPNVQFTNYNQGVTVQTLKSETSGYVYDKPDVKFEDGNSYTTPKPIVVSTFKPQGFSHHNVHKIESTGYQYAAPVPITEEPFKKIVAYTTGPAVTYTQTTPATYTAQLFNHQTIHNVATSNNYLPPVETIQTGYEYSKPSVSYEQPQSVVEYTTVQPVVSSTYQPQGFSHQTYHKVDANQVKTYDTSGYSTVKPFSGYDYTKPEVKFEDAPKTGIQYTSSASLEYKPHTFSHQTIHKIESQNYIPVSSTPAPKLEISYQQPAFTINENPLINYKEQITPVSYVQPSPQTFSHQTIHNVETKNYQPPVQIQSTDYKYEAPIVGYTYEAPNTAQPVVTTTYHPQVYGHQTIHKVEASNVNTYSNSVSGYHYEQPQVQFEEAPKTVIQYSTPAPAVVSSTYKPQTYSHQTFHNIETKKNIPVTTPSPKVEVYHQPAVTAYENPIIKFTQNVTPALTYTPISQQHEINHGFQQVEYGAQNLGVSQEGYTYSQPEIQRHVEAKSYSDASLVSHQVYHQYNDEKQAKGKEVVFVSSTPSTLIYEDHYSQYETPPKTDYQQTYTVSTVASPVVHHEVKGQYDYKTTGYSQQDGSLSQVSFSTSHIEQPKTESVHFSSIPEIQVEYNGDEYLPPVTSTAAPPVVTSTYQPRIFSTTTREYLPPTPHRSYTPKYLPPQPKTVIQYLPPNVDTYLPPSTTARPKVKSTTKAPEYLPPYVENSSVVNFESYGYKNNDDININFNTYPEYTVSTTAASPKNIYTESKTNLLGFGTVGPDAGLVSSVTYTTSAPVSSSYLPPVSSSTYLPSVTSTPTPSSTYLPPVRKIRPRVKPTTKGPEYLPPVESTTFKAPEYLPPIENDFLNFDSFGLKSFDGHVANNPYKEEALVSTSAAPIQRKQNIVIQTAKANILGFGTVGPAAGLVSQESYSTAAPVISYTQSYPVSPKVVTSTYAPIKQELIEVSPVPSRRSKPKMAVVTKINDFNPLLVRKLGAVCSCQSPVLVLKGRRPSIRIDYEDDVDYSNDYEDGRGDIGNEEWAQKSARIQSVKTVTTAPVTSTFNPIIVPDDSFYQDIDSSINITPKTKEFSSESFVSTTVPAFSTTEKVVRIRPRVKAVTAAPTYKTVVLNQEVAPNVVVKETVSRSRDDLPDCQRAGLFRHPKQCNKFYACRWDCTKQKFTVHTFNCPVHLSFDASIGACNWPSQGPACQGNTLLTNTL